VGFKYFGLIGLGNIFYSLGADARKCFSSSFGVAFRYRQKWTRHLSQYVYILTPAFGSYRLNTVVLFKSVLWMLETWSGRVVGKVQEAHPAETQLEFFVPLYECVSSDMQHSSALAVGGFSYIVLYCIGLVQLRNNKDGKNTLACLIIYVLMR